MIPNAQATSSDVIAIRVSPLIIRLSGFCQSLVKPVRALAKNHQRERQSQRGSRDTNRQPQSKSQSAHRFDPWKESATASIVTRIPTPMAAVLTVISR